MSMKDNWKYILFEDCLQKVKYTNKVLSSDYLKKGTYPIISQEEAFVSGYWNNEDDVFRVQKPVVIFGDHTRVLKYVDFDFVIGADGVKILLPKDALNTKFLKYYLYWYNIPNLGYSRHYKLLKELYIPVPTLSIQEVIVAELDKLNEILAKKREQLKELDRLGQAIFYDMFGDTIQNEKGWRIAKLKSLTLKIGSGATPKGGNENYKDEGISLIRSLNVYNGDFKYKNLAFIDDIQAKALDNVIVQKNDVLLNITGASVARCCIVPEKILPARVNQHVAILRVDPELLDYNFLCSLLISNEYQSKLLQQSKSNGATREALTKVFIESLEIVVPPLKFQRQFVEKIECVNLQKQKIKQSIVEVQQLLDYTMNKYFG